MSLTLRDARYADVRLIFEEGPHKYNDTLGNDYISTTTFLHDLSTPFDKKYWLRKKSQELHISEKRLAEQWDTITKEACERGTKTHNGLEDGINLASKFKNAIKYMQNTDGTMITVADLPNINMNVKPLDIKEFIDATENKYPDVYKIFSFYTERDYKIYAEIGVFNLDVLISGMIDVLCIREDKFIIGDWKTNRGGLKFEAGYYKKDKTIRPAQTTNVWVPTPNRTLQAPLTHLQDCNGTIYNLQLSNYAFQTECILGIPCAGMWLCHIDSDFVLNDYGMPKRFPDGLYHVKKHPKEKVTLHKMNYLKKEIMTLYNDRLRVIRANQVSNQPTLFD